MYSIINDTKKFQRLGKDVTLLRQGQLQRYLRTLKNKGVFTKSEYDTIYPVGSQPARWYGLPKLHTAFTEPHTPKFRPVNSSIKCYNYNLSKYFDNMLSSLIPRE